MPRFQAVVLALSVAIFAVCAVACDVTPPAVSHCHHEEDAPKLCKDVVSVVEHAAFDLPVAASPLSVERDVRIAPAPTPAARSASPPSLVPLRI